MLPPSLMVFLLLIRPDTCTAKVDQPITPTQTKVDQIFSDLRLAQPSSVKSVQGSVSRVFLDRFLAFCCPRKHSNHFSAITIILTAFLFPTSQRLARKIPSPHFEEVPPAAQVPVSEPGVLGPGILS